MKNLLYPLCLAAVLISACAASPSVTPTSLPPMPTKTAEAAPTLPITVTVTTTITASATAVPATITPTAAPSATATATIPAPLAATTYLTGAQVLEYAPLDRQYRNLGLLRGDIRFEEGRMITKASRWDRNNWVEISYNDMFFANTAVLTEFKFNGAGNYFSARFYGNGIGIGIGMSYTSEGGFEPTFDGKSPIELGSFLSNYMVRAGEWNSLLLAVGKDGRFRAMIIDPQRPQRISCWETQKPEWVGNGLTVSISNYSGTLELRKFMLIQFDAFEKCFK